MYVAPTQVTEDGERIVVCQCGWDMTPEVGFLVLDDEDDASHEWTWWRCSDDPSHVTRALPLPVRMARSV